MKNPRSEENNGFGPIFELRGSRATKAAVVIVLSFVSILYFTSQPSSRLDYEASICLLFISGLVGEMIRRVCLLTEEYRHLYTRYDGNPKKAFQETFKLRISFGGWCVIVVIAILTGHTLYQQGFKVFTSKNMSFFTVNAVFIPLVYFLLGLREPSKVEYSSMSEDEGGNMADGLAWNLYLGYLKFVLPVLRRQINLTEEFRYKIQVPKLLIIIPKDCHVKDKISECDERKLVNDVGNLEPLKMNRGGIRQRVYKHTVHRIVDERTGEEHFCVAEYATALMTFYEMSNDQYAGMSREERDKQVVLFIRRLKGILDGDPECKDQYKLVTVSGKEQNIGQVLIGALKDCALEIK